MIISAKSPGKAYHVTTDMEHVTRPVLPFSPDHPRLILIPESIPLSVSHQMQFRTQFSWRITFCLAHPKQENPNPAKSCNFLQRFRNCLLLLVTDMTTAIFGPLCNLVHLLQISLCKTPKLHTFWCPKLRKVFLKSSPHFLSTVVTTEWEEVQLYTGQRLHSSPQQTRRVRWEPCFVR